MTHSFLSKCAILILLGQPGSQALAGESWWDKGLDLYEDFSAGADSNKNKTSEPSIGELGDAFKQALRIGSENVVSQLGAKDGFNADPAVHIPLPSELNRVKEILARVGMSNLVDELELKLNQAAEAAVPKAKSLFLQSISAMAFDDVKTIYEGPQDAATRYFQRAMSPALSTEMRPIVEQSLSEVGVINTYDKVISEYKRLPFVPDVKADLTQHVIQKGMQGMFHYIAKEEAAIRSDPLAQSTNLLKKVFGQKR